MILSDFSESIQAIDYVCWPPRLIVVMRVQCTWRIVQCEEEEYEFFLVLNLWWWIHGRYLVGPLAGEDVLVAGSEPSISVGVFPTLGNMPRMESGVEARCRVLAWAGDIDIWVVIMTLGNG
eukprot:scaffold18043_cov46-Attheya_sp.AAC.5